MKGSSLLFEGLVLVLIAAVFCQNASRCIPFVQAVYINYDIRQALSNQCANGGSCDEDAYLGLKRTNAQEHIRRATGMSNQCANGGSCVQDAYLGLKGTNAQEHINECLSNPCVNGGTCFDQVDGYSCTCGQGFNGSNCPEDVNECLSDPCANESSSTDKVNLYACICGPGYKGAICHDDAVLCHNSSRNDTEQTEYIDGTGDGVFTIYKSGLQISIDLREWREFWIPKEHYYVAIRKIIRNCDELGLCLQNYISPYANSVFCVASLTLRTDTFVQLYNNQTTVDNINTSQISGMALSSNGLAATTVFIKNCTKHQTSSYVPRNPSQTTVIRARITFSQYGFNPKRIDSVFPRCSESLLSTSHSSSYSTSESPCSTAEEGGCTWPSPWLNTRGNITFGTDTLTGWTMTAQGSVIRNWEFLDISNFSSEGILHLYVTGIFWIGDLTYIPYNEHQQLCLATTKIKDYTYYCYQQHDHDSNGGYERGKFSTNGFITSKATVCSNTSPVPSAEFHFLPGYESAAKQWCLPSLLDWMDYTHTSAVTNDYSLENWDVCIHRLAIQFDYSTCDKQMLYSATGLVYCMVNFTSTYEYGFECSDKTRRATLNIEEVCASEAASCQSCPAITLPAKGGCTNKATRCQSCPLMVSPIEDCYEDYICLRSKTCWIRALSFRKMLPGAIITILTMLFIACETHGVYVLFTVRSTNMKTDDQVNLSHNITKEEHVNGRCNLSFGRKSHEKRMINCMNSCIKNQTNGVKRNPDNVPYKVNGSKQRVIESEVIRAKKQSILERDEARLMHLVMCKICLDADACVVFLPCSHMVACGVCADYLERCPVCRAMIDEFLQVEN